MSMRGRVQALSLLNQLLVLAAFAAIYVWLAAVWSPIGAVLVVVPLTGYVWLVFLSSRQRISGAWVLWPWSLISRDLGAIAKALRSQHLAARGRYAEAAVVADAGAERARNGWARAVCQQSAAIALVDAGDLAGAEARLDAADAGFREAGDEGGELTSLNARGAVFSVLQRLDDAEACFRQVLARARSRRLAAAAHYNLGWVAFQRARWEEAYRWWASAGDGAGSQASAWLRLGLARLALRAGSTAEARAQLPRRGPWRWRTKPAATRLVILAMADFQEGRHAEARAQVERALAVDPSADRQRLRDLEELYRQAAAAELGDVDWWLGAVRQMAARVGPNPADVRKA